MGTGHDVRIRPAFINESEVDRHALLLPCDELVTLPNMPCSSPVPVPHSMRHSRWISLLRICACLASQPGHHIPDALRPSVITYYQRVCLTIWEAIAVLLLPRSQSRTHGHDTPALHQRERSGSPRRAGSTAKHALLLLRACTPHHAPLQMDLLTVYSECA
jgi:hypothetical protein